MCNLVKKKNILIQFILTTLLQLIVYYGIAQNDSWLKPTLSKPTISVETDRDEYSLDEEIYVRFKTTFSDDSVQQPKFEGFRIIKGPSTSISSNMRGRDETEYTKYLSYTLKPNKIGTYIIESPIYFVNGMEIKVWKKIVILKTKPSKKVQSDVKIKTFAENPTEGTYRYVISEEFGYIEIRGSIRWEFYRKLTNKELKLIKKIK
jgi:hypothetical protein